MQIAVVHHRPGVVHMAAVGELDLATAPRLAAALHAELAATPRSLTLDLGAVGFCSAAGLAVLLAARRIARDSGTQLELRACSRSIVRVAHLARVDQELGLAP